MIYSIFLLFFTYSAYGATTPTPSPVIPARLVPDNDTRILANISTLQVAKGTCGQTSTDPLVALKRQKLIRIVGGANAKPHSITWIVSIRRYENAVNRSHICGGSLLRVHDYIEETDIVVTAAHCNDKNYKKDISAGAYDLMTVGVEQQESDVEKFINHEKYDDEVFENDIAIIKLAKPIKFGKQIQPICLPPPGEHLPAGTKCMVSGWGHMSEDAVRTARILQQLEVPIIDDEKCISYYKNSEVELVIDPTGRFCAGFAEGGKDSCQGDSGGPLVFKSDKGYTLEGVVSMGVGCAKANLPGIYTRVSNYIDWINGKITELSDVAKKSPS